MIAKNKVVIFIELTMDSEELLYGSQQARFTVFESLNRKLCFETLKRGQ